MAKLRINKHWKMVFGAALYLRCAAVGAVGSNDFWLTMIIL
ncbi:hypothetical protein [Budvicia aquatica]